MRHLGLCYLGILAGVAFVGGGWASPSWATSELRGGELRGLDDLQRKMVTDKAPQQGGAILVREEIVHVRPHARVVGAVVGNEMPQPVIIPNIVVNAGGTVPAHKPQIYDQSALPRAPEMEPLTGMSSQDMRAQVNFDAIQQRLQNVAGMKIDQTQERTNSGFLAGYDADYVSGQNIAVSMAPKADASTPEGHGTSHEMHYGPMNDASPFLTVDESGQLNE